MTAQNGSEDPDDHTGSAGRRQQPPPLTVLLASLREQIPRLIAGERALVSAELSERRTGLTAGSGMLVGTALVGFFGFAALVSTAIIAVALALPMWLSALLAAVVLLVIAVAFALLGVRKLKGNNDDH